MWCQVPAVWSPRSSTVSTRVDALWAMNLLTAAGVTTHLTVAEILAKPMQLHYLEGRSYAELATELSLRDANQAEQLIRFAPPGEEEAAT